MHSCIEPSLHGVDFFLGIFLWMIIVLPCVSIPVFLCYKGGLERDWNTVDRLVDRFEITPSLDAECPCDEAKIACVSNPGWII